MKITDVMTTQVEYCSPETSLTDVAMKMRELDVGSVPICQDDRLIGMCTDRDIVIEGLANQVPPEANVSQVMSGDIITGTKSMTAGQASDLMAEHQIRRLPIVENEKLVGIVSLGDLAVENRLDGEAGAALEDISYPAEPNR